MDLKVQRDPVMEHAVVLSLRMVDDSREELDQLSELAFNIESALTKIAGGEFGGVDAGAGFCLLYCYGADAEEVFGCHIPVARRVLSKTGLLGNQAIRICH